MSLFNEIKKIVGESTYLKGVQLCRQGKVLHCEVDPDGYVYAEVEGNSGRVYFLDISLEFGRQGQLVYMDGDCSCPAEYNCKHAVAAVLASLEGLQSFDLVSEVEAQPAVLEWLDRSPRQSAKLDVSHSQAVAAPNTGSDQLVYIIRNGSSGLGEIVPFKAYLKKNGEFGVNTQKYNYYYDRSGSKPAFLTIGDIGILARLQHYQRRFGYQFTSHFPAGDELIAFLREVVGTGRARGGDLKGPVLSWSPDRKASVTWSQNEDGSQSVTFVDQSNPAISFLRFPLPIYFDETSGSIGLAKTVLDQRTLTWISSAPTMLPESTSSAARKLKELGGQVPLPKIWKTEEIRDLDPVPSLTLYGETLQDDCYYHPPAGKNVRDAPSSTVYPCARLTFTYGGF